MRSLAPRGVALALALGGGVLVALAMPPLSLVPAGVLAAAALALLVARAPSARAAMRDGWWMGTVGALGTGWWIARALADLGLAAAILGTAAAVLWVGAAQAIAGLVARLAVGRGWPLPLAVAVAWVAGEWLVGHVPDIGLPWSPLALSVAEHPLLAQGAELSGPSGLSFVLAACGALTAQGWLAWRERRAPRRALACAAGVVAVLGALAAFGALRQTNVRARPLGRIAAVQPNVPQAEKNGTGTERAQVGRLGALTRRLAGHPGAPAADLVVWPETALNGFLAEFPDWRDSLAAATRAVGAPVVTGFVDIDLLGAERFRIYNAALLARTDGAIDTTQRYRKELPVPLTEMTPFLRFVPFVPEEAAGYGRGRDQAPLALPFGKAAVAICFESAFPGAARAARRRGADVLLVLTNDAWFGRSAAPWQHLAHLRLRAIETRAGAVQAANSGPSAYVDPRGRVHGVTPLFVAAAPVFAVETSDLVTPYVRFGDWVGALCVLASLAAIVARLRAPTRGRA